MRTGRNGTRRSLDGKGQADTGSGRKPEGYDDLFIFVPEARQVIRISEGTGDNLSWEDREKGYVDYIYYDQHNLGMDMPVAEGGQVLLEGMFRDLFRCTADCVPRVLDMAYGRDTIGYAILA
ncbi:hypothetical protein [uncultured Acetatifactor sp.]|uniref:hypothetical protein n=1 Tax=uncultured Acetatifactor sp. TaxID=1671927 RepID=UPI00272C407C|nr:hypothetical protein [uncultured Acetatifactor sp.]